MIKASLLAGLLAIFNPALTLPGDPPTRLAIYRCADAVRAVELLRTPAGSKFNVLFEAGFESCDEAITNVQLMMHKGKRCVIFWFGTNHAVYCMADGVPGLGV